jgi:glycosyltransferase involved in cell wall biosynthesis
VPQIVEDGNTGFLVTPGDVTAMRDRIEQLVVDEKLRHRLGEAGRAKMNREYSVECMVKRMIKVYHEVGSRYNRKEF